MKPRNKKLLSTVLLFQLCIFLVPAVVRGWNVPLRMFPGHVNNYSFITISNTSEVIPTLSPLLIIQLNLTLTILIIEAERYTTSMDVIGSVQWPIESLNRTLMTRYYNSSEGYWIEEELQKSDSVSFHYVIRVTQTGEIDYNDGPSVLRVEYSYPVLNETMSLEVNCLLDQPPLGTQFFNHNINATLGEELYIGWWFPTQVQTREIIDTPIGPRPALKCNYSETGVWIDPLPYNWTNAYTFYFDCETGFLLNSEFVQSVILDEIFWPDNFGTYVLTQQIVLESSNMYYPRYEYLVPYFIPSILTLVFSLSVLVISIIFTRRLVKSLR